jgi:hypothetical protein
MVSRCVVASPVCTNPCNISNEKPRAIMVDSDTPRGEAAMNRRAACYFSVIDMRVDERGFQVQCKRGPKPAIASLWAPRRCRHFLPIPTGPVRCGAFFFSDVVGERHAQQAACQHLQAAAAASFRLNHGG